MTIQTGPKVASLVARPIVAMYICPEVGAEQ
jgi:hypothetical protein